MSRLSLLVPAFLYLRRLFGRYGAFFEAKLDHQSRVLHFGQRHHFYRINKEGGRVKVLEFVDYKKYTLMPHALPTMIAD